VAIKSGQIQYALRICYGKWLDTLRTEFHNTVADPRARIGTEIKNTAFRSPGDSFVYPRIARLFLPFSKITRLLVRLDHIARVIENTNHSIM
jgi:hypothetical protein